jgi:hypothetical protein
LSYAQDLGIVVRAVGQQSNAQIEFGKVLAELAFSIKKDAMNGRIIQGY